MVGGPSSSDSGGPPAAAGPITPGTTRRKKRFNIDSQGRVHEYWVDVPEKKRKPPMSKKGRGVELAKEFKFDDEISIGTLFPSLKGTRFDALHLTKTSILWLAKDATETMKAGLWFDTDVQFRGLLQPIADVLREVFGQENPGLHLSAHLGVAETWSDELIATGFTFRGSLEGINRGFGDFLTFRSAGMMLNVSPDTQSSDLHSTYSFFGSLNLQIPNSVTPLVLGYTLVPKQDTLDIIMTLGKGGRWESVFGVKGIDIDEVTFVTTLVKSDVHKSLEFAIKSKWTLGDIPVELGGHIKKDGSSLRAFIQSLTMDDLRKLFNSMTGSHLEPVEQDIRFNNLILEISQGRLALHGEVVVDDYKVVAAEVLVTVDGIRISGAVSDLHIGEDVHIKAAQLEFIVGDVNKPEVDEKGKAAEGAPPNTEVVKKEKKGTPVAAVVRGEVEVNTGGRHLKFNVAAAITKSANGPINYFVYGQLDCENFSIGKMLGGDMNDGHPMDLALDRVTLIAASEDNINAQGLNASRFPVSKGIFLCAELKSVPFVGDLCKSSTPEERYVLHAGYSSSSGLKIRVILPENIRIELSPTVVSGPLVLSVDTKPLKIMFSAKLWVKPEGQEKPLELTLALAADEMKAEAFAEMKGWWDNPLDLSPRVKVGPYLTLKVSIDYKQFVSTGMPSGLGFVGGFVVDDIDKYFLAFDIGSNPKETLIKIQMTQLDAGKVINLVNAVAQVDIAKPKHELIRFEDVNIYASPIGCIVGTQEFPPGFVVKGKAYILDKMVRIDCRIGNQGLKLEGEIEGFSLGPLTVRGGKRLDGTRAENAIINLEITKERQHFDLSGSIALWGLETSVYVLAEAMPNPQLEFNFELGWSELLKFQVNGKLVKPAGDEKALTNLDNADFVVHAVLEQNILSEISEAMQKWFKSAQVSVHEGVEEAKRKVDQAKIEFERKCEMAQAEVRRAKDAFEAEMKVVESAFLEKEAACEKARIDNELWIIQEEKRADREIANAKGALDASQKAFENDMEAKKRALSEKQRQGDEAIGSALRDLQDKRISLQRTFGSAIDALESARRSVRDEEDRVRDAERCVDDAEEDYDDCSLWEELYYWVRLVARRAELWVIKCALGAAELILKAARLIVEGALYNAAKLAVSVAEGALWVARSTWDGLIAAAKAALDGVNAVHAGIIAAAKAAVVVANQVALSIKQAAAAIKDQLLAANAEILKLARNAVMAVAKGASFVIFNTALEALEFAKKDTTWVSIAKGALTAAEAVATAALAAAAWLAERLCDTLNIKRVELTASLKTLTQGEAFTIRVVGTVLGNDFDFTATWSPKNMLSFIARLCQKLWDDFIDSAGDLFAEHKRDNKPAVAMMVPITMIEERPYRPEAECKGNPGGTTNVAIVIDEDAM